VDGASGAPLITLAARPGRLPPERVAMIEPVTAPDKAALRRTLRRLRAGLPDHVRRAAAEQIARQGRALRLIVAGRRIGFYMPAKGELDCLPLLDRALWLGAECYLPVVPQRSQKKLWFTRLGDGRYWSVNRYGIAEYGQRQDRYRAARLDLLFLPLLGFDARGYRVGMGGGYYDASLAHLARQRRWRRPKLIGLAYACQEVAGFSPDPWDVPLDGVLTETGFRHFRKGLSG